jgi:transposase
MLIQIMYKQGYSKKRIARELGISVNTVRKYIVSDESPSYSARPPTPLKLDSYRVYIKQRLEAAHPNWIPATVLFREIKAMGYTGGETTVRNYLRSQKPVASEEPLIRFETEPGQQMQVDWAEFQKGRNRLSAFVATLGYSRASYVEFVNNEKLETLIRCHENAFDYFGGVPKEILYDNMKTVIIERNYYGDGKHRLQSGFWDFSKHHNFIPRVCRPYRAKTKGKVERFIHYLRYSFYQPFLAELKPNGILMEPDIANQRVLAWLNTIANRRVHGTTQAVPFERLVEEQAALEPMTSPYTGVAVKTLATQQTTTEPTLGTYPEVTILQHELSTYEQLLATGGQPS